MKLTWNFNLDLFNSWNLKLHTSIQEPLHILKVGSTSQDLRFVVYEKNLKLACNTYTLHRDAKTVICHWHLQRNLNYLDLTYPDSWLTELGK